MKTGIPNRRLTLRKHESGASSVEYAVTLLYWVVMTIAVVEFGRIFYLLNASYEATRIGARYAIVCGVAQTGNNGVKAKVKELMPILQDSNINISYASSACTFTSCPGTTVTISGVTINSFIPLVPFAIPLPAASTTMVPETRRSAAASLPC